MCQGHYFSDVNLQRVLPTGCAQSSADRAAPQPALSRMAPLPGTQVYVQFPPPAGPGVREPPPPGLGTHQEADIVEAVEKQPALILLQPHGLQPLPDALFQRPRT